MGFLWMGCPERAWGRGVRDPGRGGSTRRGPRKERPLTQGREILYSAVVKLSPAIRNIDYLLPRDTTLSGKKQAPEESTQPDTLVRWRPRTKLSKSRERQAWVDSRYHQCHGRGGAYCYSSNKRHVKARINKCITDQGR